MELLEVVDICEFDDEFEGFDRYVRDGELSDTRITVRVWEIEAIPLMYPERSAKRESTLSSMLLMITVIGSWLSYIRFGCLF